MLETVTDSVELGRHLCVLIDKSGNLPVVGTGIIFRITRNWLYRFTVFLNRRFLTQTVKVLTERRTQCGIDASK